MQSQSVTTEVSIPLEALAKKWDDNYNGTDRNRLQLFVGLVNKVYGLNLAETGSTIRIRGHYPSTPHHEENAAVLRALAPGLVVCDPHESGELVGCGVLERRAGEVLIYQVRTFRHILGKGAGWISVFNPAPQSRIVEVPMMFRWGYPNNLNALCIPAREWRRTQEWLTKWLPEPST